MASSASPDGLVWKDPTVTITLRASGADTATSLTAETAVAGFGGLKQLVFLLEVTGVSLVGGSSPTAQLQVYVQRSPDGGSNWDDLLGFQTAALSNGAGSPTPVQHVGDYLWTTAVVAPALLVNGTSTLPLAQRASWLSDKLRAYHKIVTGGSPTSVSVTWSLTARGRP